MKVIIGEELLESVVKSIQQRAGKEELTRQDLEESIIRASHIIGNFCRYKQLTDEFKYIISDMAIDIYDMLHVSNDNVSEDDFDQRVKKLTQGDTTIEFNIVEKQQAFSSIEQIKEKYRDELVPLRSIYWR